MLDLYYRWKAFGEGIGDDHAAVWFWKKTMQNPSKDGAADNVDVARAIAYCTKLRLKPSGGPYLVFTTTYPDEKVALSAMSVIELGSSAEQIDLMLVRLGDQLVTGGVIKNREFLRPTGTDDFWRAWYDATRDTLLSLQLEFRFWIRTPTLSLESRPGQ